MVGCSGKHTQRCTRQLLQTAQIQNVTMTTTSKVHQIRRENSFKKVIVPHSFEIKATARGNLSSSKTTVLNHITLLFVPTKRKPAGFSTEIHTSCSHTIKITRNPTGTRPDNNLGAKISSSLPPCPLPYLILRSFPLEVGP